MPTSHYRYQQIQTQVAQWLAAQPTHLCTCLETEQGNDVDGAWFYRLDMATPQKICRITVNTPIFAPYRYINIEIASMTDDDCVRIFWCDNGQNPTDADIQKQLQQLSQWLFQAA